ncbi:hypothetical protein O6H91_02G002100 [Diphasiastrum complanatum]|uniref:Uncharacterized protein n=1 Tax=Diphasiastrum complanatum TaxID=34168 RepID=A0ACC2ECB7_DIPCM|nr:hypothetical protein O6H91_02G002100 [Diphasiastrum complanatum]
MNQRVTWRGDSALHDGHDSQIDLVGGYYDAGDNVKYTFPMAFTITMLSWGVIEYGNKYNNARELQHALDSIRWGTDYLLKAYSGPTQLWVQVGAATADHQCWERPEDMDTPRTATQVNATTPGTEVTAETAAALAAASIVFSGVNRTYSIKLLKAALALFNFSNTHQSSYTGECPFYCSYSGYHDELLWAASWLYKATNSSYYLEYVITYKNFSYTISEFSWDNKLAGVQVLLAKTYFEGENSLLQYKNQADDFLCFILPNSSMKSVQYTPGGFLYMRSGANTQYAGGVAFLSAVYADYLQVAKRTLTCKNTSFSTSNIFGLVSSQVNYILGQNPKNMSYMVGYGNRYPLQPHHRGASIVSIHVNSSHWTCGEGFNIWFHRNAPNPNILIGAIVGGLTANDQFTDERYISSELEPTTYINAPFCSVFARLIV